MRELVRQKDSALFLRLAASQDKAGILQLAQQGQVVEQPADLLREPYVVESLKIPEPCQQSETQLETLLCDHHGGPPSRVQDRACREPLRASKLWKGRADP